MNLGTQRSPVVDPLTIQPGPPRCPIGPCHLRFFRSSIFCFIVNSLPFPVLSGKAFEASSALRHVESGRFRPTAFPSDMFRVRHCALLIISRISEPTKYLTDIQEVPAGKIPQCGWCSCVHPQIFKDPISWSGHRTSFPCSLRHSLSVPPAILLFFVAGVKC